MNPRRWSIPCSLLGGHLFPMRVPLLPRLCGLSIATAAGVFFLVGASAWAQAAGKGAVAAPPTAPAPPVPGLFPEPEPRLVEKATLHGLLQALGAHDHETVTQMTWQLLAAMA